MRPAQPAAAASDRRGQRQPGCPPPALPLPGTPGHRSPGTRICCWASRCTPGSGARPEPGSSRPGGESTWELPWAAMGTTLSCAKARHPQPRRALGLNQASGGYSATCLGPARDTWAAPTPLLAPALGRPLHPGNTKTEQEGAGGHPWGRDPGLGSPPRASQEGPNERPARPRSQRAPAAHGSAPRSPAPRRPCRPGSWLLALPGPGHGSHRRCSAPAINYLLCILQ